MSGKVKIYQVQVYMTAREKGFTQVEAAELAGFSARTGQRIEAGDHQPNRGRIRDWRSTPDPLAEVWESELEPMLKANPGLQPTTLFEWLQERYPGKLSPSASHGATTSCRLESLAWRTERDHVRATA